MCTWHILTGEYPPRMGGVSDYTATLAGALAAAGDRVHVWTAGRDGTEEDRVTVHRVCGEFGLRDLARAGELMDACSDGGRVLVQWVPHAFGGRGVNLRVPLWLYGRSVRRPNAIDLMVHEPFLPFTGTVTHRTAALVQRAMTATVLRSASRVFVATPAWTVMCRPLASSVPFRWIPVPSGVRVRAASERRASLRREWNIDPETRVIGCFGRAGMFQQRILEELGLALLQRTPRARLLLIGLGSDATLARILARHPSLSAVMSATGASNGETVSMTLSASDLMVQPYAAGVCTRHSSAATVLAHGRPMVTNRGRFTEPIWDGAVATTSIDDPGGFVDVTLRLLDDPAERARLSQAALDLYDECFDVRHTVAALRGA